MAQDVGVDLMVEIDILDIDCGLFVCELFAFALFVGLYLLFSYGDSI